MVNMWIIINNHNDVEAERMVFTKLGSQVEKGAVTNVGNINWGGVDFTASDQ